ncbi:MAG: glycosyltransferase family 4 protein [Deltaproteobacteria bacterium]|nr:glycosyltransferase family 4 protein [Deltaproteobacteria bacterium]
MRVGINLLHLSTHEAGVACYARSLVRALLASEGVDAFILYGRKRHIEHFRRANVQLRSVRFLPDNRWFRILWEQLAMGGAIRVRGPDVFHWPDYSRSLLAPGARSVVTVHDLAFLRLNHIYDQGRTLYKRLMAKVSVSGARAIIAVSENTARDITELLGIPRARINPIPNGIDSDFRQLPPHVCEEYRKRRLGGIGPFILFVGTVEPRKNVMRLLEAHEIMQKMGIKGIPLVLAGRQGWKSEQIVKAIQKGMAKGSVCWLGYVPREELPILYNLCRIFVYPSLYEGFGFPPLEAMACGAPVITSDNSSLSEVTGDAALLIDPLDAEALAGAMARLIEDHALRDSMHSRGIEHAGKYRWEETARRTIEVYRKVNCCESGDYS